MKGKPDTEQFKLKKDPVDFLEGGAADVADRVGKAAKVVPASPAPAVKTPGEAKVHREQKVFRLPLDLINELKREAYERTVKSGSRVTETELVEQALRKFLK